VRSLGKCLTIHCPLFNGTSFVQFWLLQYARHEQMTTNNETIRLCSLAEVEAHCRINDFWTVIDNKVYDLTGFAHPGGVLINSCAGVDATIMFHQNHFESNDKVDRVLASRCFGKLDSKSPQSPHMGAFYRDASVRVSSVLSTLKVLRRPPWSLCMLFVDLTTTLLLVGLSLSQLFSTWTLPVLVAISYLLTESTARLRSHAHAVGHLQLGVGVAWALEALMHVFSETSFVYALPSVNGENMRKKINQSLKRAQEEYSHRGPFEHQALHHVKVLASFCVC
jgi:hypothetical protein